MWITRTDYDLLIYLLLFNYYYLVYYYLLICLLTFFQSCFSTLQGGGIPCNLYLFWTQGHLVGIYKSLKYWRHNVGFVVKTYQFPKSSGSCSAGYTVQDCPSLGYIRKHQTALCSRGVCWSYYSNCLCKHNEKCKTVS